MPVASCVRQQALVLAASREAADVAARAAIGMCGTPLLRYSAAVRAWPAMRTPEEAEAFLRTDREKLTTMAITIIVRERMKRDAPRPPIPATPPKSLEGI
jgi:hypothetical protein